MEKKEIERAHEQLLNDLQKELLSEIGQQVNLVVIKEHTLSDQLGLVSDRPGDRYYFASLQDIQSENQEVEKQKLRLGLDHREQGGQAFRLYQVKEASLVFRSDDTQKRLVTISIREFPLLERTRGKAIALEYFQQMKPESLRSVYQRGNRVAERDHRPVNDVIRQMLRQKILAHEQKQRGRFAKLVSRADKEIQRFSNAVREVGVKINEQLKKIGNMSKELQQQPKFQWLKESLLQKKEQGEQSLEGYRHLQHNFQDRMKIALHDQYPELQFRDLSPGEINRLYLASTEINKGGVKELRRHLEQQRDEKGLRALEKAEKSPREQKKELNLLPRSD